VKSTTFSGMKDAIVFILLVVVLLVRPAGLLGSARAEKV
jgi:branched-subunit amino acid ABC-type transport system permease component